MQRKLKIIKIKEGIFKHVLNDDINIDTVFFNTDASKLSIDLGTIVFEIDSNKRVFRIEEIEVFGINATNPTPTATLDDLVIVLSDLRYPLLSTNTVTANSSSPYTSTSQLYVAISNGTGYSIGNTIRRLEVIEIETNVSTISWTNLTTGVNLTVPNQSHITVMSSSGLTDAELRANPIPVNMTGIATETKQDTANTTLTLIKNILVDINSKLNQLKATVEEFTATSGQTTFNLANLPIGAVSISINGTRVTSTCISVNNKTVTYNSANNAGYDLVAGDIVIFDF